MCIHVSVYTAGRAESLHLVVFPGLSAVIPLYGRQALAKENLTYENIPTSEPLRGPKSPQTRLNLFWGVNGSPL